MCTSLLSGWCFITLLWFSELILTCLPCLMAVKCLEDRGCLFAQHVTPHLNLYFTENLWLKISLYGLQNKWILGVKCHLLIILSTYPLWYGWGIQLIWCYSLAIGHWRGMCVGATLGTAAAGNGPSVRVPWGRQAPRLYRPMVVSGTVWMCPPLHLQLRQALRLVGWLHNS